MTVVLMGLRAVVAAVQLVSGVLLWRRERSAFVLARAALIVSAALITCEVGWRMTPTNADPTFRWWIVAVYWVYAALASWWLTRQKRSGRLSR